MVLACAYPADRADDETAAEIEAVFAIGIDRTPQQDIDYVLRQLTQIALRALSPGINDPFTAIECINRLKQGLRRASSRPRPSQYRLGKSGRLRVIAQADEFLPLAIPQLDSIARAGGDNGDIVSLLFEVIEAIAENARYEDDRNELFAFALSLKQESDIRLNRSRDRDQVERAYASLIRTAIPAGCTVKKGPSPARVREQAG